MKVSRRALLQSLAGSGIASPATARFFSERGGGGTPIPPTGGAIAFQTANTFQTANLFNDDTIAPTGPFTVSYTKSWTSNAAGGVLLVEIIGDAVGGTYGDDLLSVTYGGVPLSICSDGVTQAKSGLAGRWQYLYKLLNPTHGTANIVVTFSGAHFAVFGAVEYLHVRQTSFPEKVVVAHTSAANHLATTIATVTPYSWVVLAETGYDQDHQCPRLCDPASPARQRGADNTRQGGGNFWGVWNLCDSGGPVIPSGNFTITTSREFIGFGGGIGHIAIAFAPSAPSTAQAVASIALRNSTFTGGDPDGQIVGELVATLTNSALNPDFIGTYSVGGTDAAKFRVDNTTSPPRLLLNGTQTTGTYSISLIATGSIYSNSPFTQTGLTVTGSAFSSNMTVLLTGLPATDPGVTVEADGTGTLAFDMSLATDKGDYVGDFVTQKCYMQTAVGGVETFFSVFFRPDALTAGARTEVVVERFKWPLGGGETPTHVILPSTAFPKCDDIDQTIIYPFGYNLPYRCQIKQGASIKAVVTVTKHWWGARWRWFSTERPLVRSRTDLFADKSALPITSALGFSLQRISTALPTPDYPIQPMGTAGVKLYMPDGGARPDLGWYVEWNADYMAFTDTQANTLSLQGSRAWGDAVGSMPFWFRDRRTGKLADTYVNARNYAYINLGGPGGQAFPQAANPGTGTGGAVPIFVLNSAHMPAPSWMMWRLTDDPYYYEGAEAVASFAFFYGNGSRGLSTPPTSGGSVVDLQGLASLSELRCVSWGLRDIFRMAGWAFATPPNWLLAKSYWTQVLDDNLTIAKRYATSTAHVHTVFRCPWATGTSWFELPYYAITLGWAVWTGKFPSDWTDHLTWMAPSVIGACDGLSGWPRANPVMGYLYWPNMVALTSPSAWEGNNRYLVYSATNPTPDGVVAAQGKNWDTASASGWADCWTKYKSTINNVYYGGAGTEIDMTTWTDTHRIYQNQVTFNAGASGTAWEVSGCEYLLNLRGAVGAVCLGLGRTTHIPTLYDGSTVSFTTAGPAYDFLMNTSTPTGLPATQEVVNAKVNLTFGTTTPGGIWNEKAFDYSWAIPDVYP